MKKKFMMVTLLLGTLMLGACVDDNETASVSAVREATAKQLKSVAAMNRAEAEAQKTLAAAEVALLQAKAAAEKANAEYSRAQLEIRQKTLELMELRKEEQTIENQREQVRLETALADLEKAKKQAQADLDSIAAEMEKAAVQAQADLLDYQRQLMAAQETLLDYQEQLEQAKTDAEKAIINAERTKVSALAQFYSQAVNDWVSVKGELTNLNSDLVQFENELISAQQLKQRNIIANNNKIALYTIYIEKYKQYENYTEDFAALQSKYDEAIAEQKKVNDAYMGAKTLYDAVRPDLTSSEEMEDAILNSVLYKFYDDGFLNGSYTTLDPETGDPVRHRVDYVLYNFMWDNWLWMAYYYTDRTYDFEGENFGLTSDPTVDYLGSDMVVWGPDFSESTLSASLRSFELDVVNRTAQLESYLKNDQDQLKNYKRLHDGEVTKGDFGQGSYDDQGQWVPSTEKCKNAVDSIAAAKKKYEDETDAAKKQQYYQEYGDALQYENNIASWIAYYESEVEDRNNYIADFKLQWDMMLNFDTYMEKLQADVDARNAQEEKEYAEKLAAWTDMMKVKDAYEALKPEVRALTIQVSNWSVNEQLSAYQIKSQIENYQSEIERLQKENADWEARNEEYGYTEAYLDYKEWLVEKQKAAIVAKEAQVQAYEIVVANAKAALEAAMPKAEEE